jgi:predicted DNA-binding ribbon-helix-helix protein
VAAPEGLYFSLAAKFLGRLASFVRVAVVAWMERREGVMSVVEDSDSSSSS